jgi:hypothetical protein
METAPRDGTAIRVHSLETGCEFNVVWSTSYSIHGLGGCWADGVGQSGDMHLLGWRPVEAPAPEPPAGEPPPHERCPYCIRGTYTDQGIPVVCNVCRGTGRRDALGPAGELGTEPLDVAFDAYRAYVRGDLPFRSAAAAAGLRVDEPAGEPEPVAWQLYTVRKLGEPTRWVVATSQDEALRRWRVGRVDKPSGIVFEVDAPNVLVAAPPPPPPAGPSDEPGGIGDDGGAP